ncbi:MAG: hypothetical protein ACI8R9_000456 [Paraglaciecola sp.]|jgi:hypothetical protein
MPGSYPQIMGKVLGIVYHTLATHITKKQTAQTGAVTLIQRLNDEHPVHHFLGNLRFYKFISDEFVAQR